MHMTKSDVLSRCGKPTSYEIDEGFEILIYDTSNFWSFTIYRQSKVFLTNERVVAVKTGY